MNIIKLAIESGFSPPECPDEWADKIYQSTLKRLEAFAKAAIEEYKASLVPVAYIHRNEYDEYRLEPLDTFKVKDVPKNVDTPLYALGATK